MPCFRSIFITNDFETSKVEGNIIQGLCALTQVKRSTKFIFNSEVFIKFSQRLMEFENLEKESEIRSFF